MTSASHMTPAEQMIDAAFARLLRDIHANLKTRSRTTRLLTDQPWPLPSTRLGQAGHLTAVDYLISSIEESVPRGVDEAIAQDRPDLTYEAFISVWAGSGAFPEATVVKARARLAERLRAHLRT